MTKTPTGNQFNGDPDTPCVDCGYRYDEHDNRFENTSLPDSPSNTVWVEGCPVLPGPEPTYFEPGVNTYVTFGSKYRYERHPKEHWVHPDGWLRVVTPPAGSPPLGERTEIVRLLGFEWAFDYPEESFKEGDKHLSYYPLGELAVLTRNGLRLTEPGLRTLLANYNVEVA